MKTKEKNLIKTQSIDELKKEVRELKHQLVKISISRYTKPSKNTREGRSIRRKIAVILTILKEREGEKNL